ncbi:MAG: hypothetical protein GF317_12320 [Candidatus Lokiarchaeota archaeon]|nr:hypothetical protein [Candidatus Lokiarchaeota archaeon]MBD3200433.1 hypothetical protein [Candidatus Lokiarchaeota archaeon]
MERQHAKQKMIKDINSDDLRIQVTGFVNEIENNNSFILNDKTGSIKVNIEEYNFNFKENDLINVIGEYHITTSGEKIIEAEIIQDMKNLNFKYYQQLYELKKELL